MVAVVVVECNCQVVNVPILGGCRWWENGKQGTSKEKRKEHQGLLLDVEVDIVMTTRWRIWKQS